MGKVFLKLDMEKGGRPHWDGMRIDCPGIVRAKF